MAETTTYDEHVRCSWRLFHGVSQIVALCFTVFRLLQFDPFAPLYSELKFASNKKTFKKFFFEFNHTMLAYRKESKVCSDRMYNQTR